MNTHAGSSSTKRPIPSTPSTKSRSQISNQNPRLVKSTKSPPPLRKDQTLKKSRAPGTSYAAANYSIPSVSLHRSLHKISFPHRLAAAGQQESARRPQQAAAAATAQHKTLFHSPIRRRRETRNETKTKQIQRPEPSTQAEKGRWGEKKKRVLVFIISCTTHKWQQRSKPNPQRRSAWVIIPVRGAVVAPPVAVPGLRCGFPQSPPHPYPSSPLLRSSPLLLPYPPTHPSIHPSIRGGAVFVVFKLLLLVSLFLSSSQFVSGISVFWVFFDTEIQPHIDSPFLLSSRRGVL